MSKSNSTNNQFTGRHMLTVMIAFFGVIITVNVTMAVYANTTWSGFVVRNSYVAGLEFNKKAEEASKQAALGWTSQTIVSDGHVSFSITDDKGESVVLAEGTATFRRPVSDTEDTVVTLSRHPDGSLIAPMELRDGSWIVELNAATENETPWHEMERLLLRGGQTR